MKLMTNYSDKQKEAIEKLEKLKVGALFMDPGVGKTRVALSLIESSKADFTLFIVPLRTKDNLIEEINKWEFNKPFEIVGVESLSQSDRIYLETREMIEKHKSTFCVVDESLKIKNAEAIRTQRTVELGKMCEYRLILNGTPLSKNILDLWSQMEFLSPKILKMTLNQFKDTFVEYVNITRLHDNGRSSTRESIIAFHNLEYLYSIIRPYVYDAELELDTKKIYIDVEYQLNGEEWIEYEVLKNEWLDRVEEYWDNPNIFMAMLQDIHHKYCDTESKFERLKEILEHRGTDKTLIYCKFIKSKEAIEERFPEATVLTYGKHAFGLNLQSHNTIVFFDKTFDYALVTQAEHRIYRTGQTDDCYFYNLNGDVNLEKTIIMNIDAKSDLLQSLKTEIMKEPKKMKEMI